MYTQDEFRVRGSREQLIVRARTSHPVAGPSCLLGVLQTVNQQDLNSKNKSAVTQQHVSLVVAKLRNCYNYS